MFSVWESGIDFPELALAVTFLHESLCSKFPQNLLVRHALIFVLIFLCCGK